jgi:hypothetical protein
VILAVAGAWRSGTSCAAGALEKLGFDFGTPFRAPNRFNEKGYFEDQGLRDALLRCYDEPWLNEILPYEERVEELRRYLATRSGPRAAVKHPLLSILLPELREAAGDGLRLVAVRRPLSRSVASLDRTGWWNSEGGRRAIERMNAALDAEIKRCPRSVEIGFDELVERPAETIGRIVSTLGLPADAAALARAAAFVDANLKSF